jgi:hypothetical protein
MNQVRGVLYIVLGFFAFYRGWQIHHGPWAWGSLTLGVLAIALGIYLMTRRAHR